MIDAPSGRTITYRQLAESVRAAAAGLADRGFGKGDVFAHYAPSLPEYAVTFLGVAMVGGVNTSANPMLTAEELARQLRDCGARMLVTVPDRLEEATLAAEASAVQEIFVYGEADGALPVRSLLNADGEPPEVTIDPANDLVALPYSSGTTGVPKGVMLTHRNLVANICQVAAHSRGQVEREVAVLPFFHIYGLVYIMNTALYRGDTCVAVLARAAGWLGPSMPSRREGSELLGIEPKIDLPVGKNLHDHPFVVIVWLTDQPSLRTAMTPENVALFEREGRGPLTSGFSEGGAFIRTRSDLDAPDIQFHFGGAASIRENADPPIPHDGFTIFPTLLAPTSRGQVTLRSALAHAKPRILHNYYATDDDTRSIIDGTRVGLEIASRPALRKLRTADWAVPESDSDADILRFARRNTRTVFHPVGTCAMGTVVDSELRVRGVERLRVVDASVMPTVPRGNTNAPTIMIAEKAADLIRGLPPLPRQDATRAPAASAPGA